MVGAKRPLSQRGLNPSMLWETVGNGVTTDIEKRVKMKAYRGQLQAPFRLASRLIAGLRSSAQRFQLRGQRAH